MEEPEIAVTCTVIEGKNEGLSVSLSKPRSLIGRRTADIALTDPKVSHVHAAIEVTGRTVRIIDLESRNGVYINGQKTVEGILANLDEVQVGTTKMRILIVENLGLFKKRNLLGQQTGQDITSGDIGSLIDDELSRFSKWDLSSPCLGGDSVDGYVLEVLEGPDSGKKIRLEKKETSVGRGKADISLNDADVSRLHAVLEVVAKKQVLLRDMGSTNGTYVNRKKITVVKLAPNDQIQIGGTLCRFLIED